MVVKVCGLTSLEDADFAQLSGADLLGFVFEPTSKRLVRDREPVSAWASSAKKVAVFGQDAQDVEGFDLVQAIDLGGRQGIVSLRPRPGDDVASLVRAAAGHPTVVLDKYEPGTFGGTGMVLDWLFCGEFVEAFPGRVILAGGLGPDNVAEAIRQVRPWGVDACSGLERSYGVKDHDKVLAYIDAAKSA